MALDEKDISVIEGLLEKHARLYETKLETFAQDIKEEFRHQIGIHGEEFQHKLDLVVEGQQMLVERMDRMEVKVERVEAKVDKLELKVDVLEAKLDRLEAKVSTVADDLSAHRADTEAHHGVYRVKE